jgi:hypothetical protein
MHTDTECQSAGCGRFDVNRWGSHPQATYGSFSFLTMVRRGQALSVCWPYRTHQGRGRSNSWPHLKQTWYVRLLMVNTRLICL